MGYGREEKGVGERRKGEREEKGRGRGGGRRGKRRRGRVIRPISRNPGSATAHYHASGNRRRALTQRWFI
jgi:hypothetical protein